ncbi:MAG: DUF2267 domain-containing protein [Pseudomonadota bacterium]
MTMTGLAVFDDTIHTTNTWLHEISARMGWDDRHQSYRLLRVCLHTVRDRLQVNSAAKFGAQLPMIMRGLYYEGWRPSQVPSKERTIDDFLADVRAAFSENEGFDAEAAFREVLLVMGMHMSAGELEDVQKAMPTEIKTLWDTEPAS